MRTITVDRIHEQDRQEELPDYSEDFPCIISRAEIDKYPRHYVPWHWHQPIELFYMESGELEYHTPGGVTCFPTGTGGIINSGVIHMTQPHAEKGETVQFLHIFDPFFLADSPRGRIARLYVLPYLNSNVEILSFSPSIPEQRELLSMLRDSFQIDENQMGFEITLRAALSAIWLKILDAMPESCRITIDKNVNECLKRMLNELYTHALFGDDQDSGCGSSGLNQRKRMLPSLLEPHSVFTKRLYHRLPARKSMRTAAGQ